MAHAEEVLVATPLSDPLGFAARAASVFLIVGMLLLPFSTVIDPTGAGLLLLLKYSSFLWAFYITIQVMESAQRDFTAVWSWVMDSLLSVIVLVVGISVFIKADLNFDQYRLLIESILWDVVDLVLGLAIPYIIAGSVKNRIEREAH